MKRLAPRLTLHTFEDRSVPAVWNNPWADPGNLTISFVPDGTDVNGAPSQLFQEFPLTEPAVWQREVLRAFQTWAAQTNINLSVVPDDGSPLGAPGPIQGSTTHGDIRIAARPLGLNQLAVTTPFDLFGGWSGTVVLNANQVFGVAATLGILDLYTVALQESGHAYGLPNSTSPSSAMYTEYLGPRAGLSAGDVTSIQGLYGARTPDRFDAVQDNDVASRVTGLRFVANLGQLNGANGTDGPEPYVAAGDLGGADVDYYSVAVPAGTTSFSVSLRAKGLSLLGAKVTVLTAAGAVVASAAATDPANGNLTLNVNNATAGATYLVRIEQAAGNVFGVGAYRLAVGTATAAAQATAGPAAGPFGTNGHSNDRPWTGTVLGDARTTADRRWDFTYRASVTDAADADWYRIHTTASPEKMIVTAWGLEVNRLDPVVQIYDAGQNLVTMARVLANDRGLYTLQLDVVTANSDYYVKVAADPASGTTGNYFLGIDCRPTGVTMDAFAAGTLTHAAPQAVMTLTVFETQLFHFALSAATSNPTVASAVRVSIRDQLGREVFTLIADAGQTVSGDVLLGAGVYTLVFSAGTRDPGVGLPDMTFGLEGLVRSDPVGVTPSDTSGSSGSTSTPSKSSTSTYNGPYASPYR